MEQIIVKQEIIESVYKEISILEKLEEKYDLIVDLIKKFEKVSNDSSELNLKYLSIFSLSSKYWFINGLACSKVFKLWVSLAHFVK